MAMLTWALTVAAVIEHEGKFLIVEETDSVHPERVFNQPAGHVEPGESLLDAVCRETWEETGLAFTPQRIVGIYQLQARNGRDYVRICFSGTVPPGSFPEPQDPHVLAAHWLTREEIAQRPRSSVVLHCMDDYLRGESYPLALVEHFQKDR